VLSIFKNSLDPMDITHELPVEESLRFLDLRLCFLSHHTCWTYAPRGKKPLLHYQSAHSKLVKRGVVNLCLKNAITKSCPHSVKTSFDAQIARLLSGGYPNHVLISVAEKLLQKIKNPKIIQCKKRDRNQRPAVVPYIHHFSHGLKKIGNRVNVNVVFSAPCKLSSLCKKVNSSSDRTLGCTKKHHSRFVPCSEGVVYAIPLSCGKQYIGQTGRCLNDRLREHHYNINRVISGNLGIHCRDCRCSADLSNCTVIARSGNQLTREIIEAEKIARLDQQCVSVSSVASSKKKLDYLEISSKHH
ncbi:unnamed protein product, partial [Ixodes hexagonus]